MLKKIGPLSKPCVVLMTKAEITPFDMVYFDNLFGNSNFLKIYN